MFNESDIKVIDSHIHIMGGLENEKKLISQKNKYGYDKVNILAVDALGDLTQTAKCIAFKIKHPGNYAFAGLRHTGDESFLCQAKNAFEMGFDGFKMIEGKPGVRRKIGMALNDDIYDHFYEYLSEKQLPVVLHACDPAVFWDPKKAPAFAKKQGWYYADKEFPTKEQIENEVYAILEKHSELKLILAHFFFTADDLEKAANIFEKYPNVYFDITPGMEMFAEFSKNIEKSKNFFKKYSERIIFGTDNFDVESKKDEKDKDVINETLYNFLFGCNEFKAWNLTLKGIGADKKAREDILRYNFERIAGSPRNISFDAVTQYCKSMLRKPFIKEQEAIDTLKKVKTLVDSYRR